MYRNAIHHMQVLNMVPAANITASANGSEIDLKDYEGPVALVLDFSAGGVGATIDAKLQHADTSGGSYTDVASAAFTQVGNTASVQKFVVNADEIKRYVRIAYTVGGTANFRGGIKGYAIKKYIG